MNEYNPYEFDKIPEFAMQPARENIDDTFDPSIYERLLAGLEETKIEETKERRDSTSEPARSMDGFAAASMPASVENTPVDTPVPALASATDASATVKDVNETDGDEPETMPTDAPSMDAPAIPTSAPAPAAEVSTIAEDAPDANTSVPAMNVIEDGAGTSVPAANVIGTEADTTAPVENTPKAIPVDADVPEAAPMDTNVSEAASVDANAPETVPMDTDVSEAIPAGASAAEGTVISAGDDVITDSLRLVDMTTCEPVRIYVEEDILVPDVKPDLASVLAMDGALRFSERDGKISGDLMLQTLYIPQGKGADRSVVAIESRIPFQQGSAFDTTPTDDRDVVDIKASAVIESLDYSVINERKFRVKAVISAEGRKYHSRKLELFQGMKTDDVQMLKETLTVTDVILRKSERLELEEDLILPDALPEVGSVLRCDVTLVENHKQISREKVVISGTAYCNIMYLPMEDASGASGKGASELVGASRMAKADAADAARRNGSDAAGTSDVTRAGAARIVSGASGTAGAARIAGGASGTAGAARIVSGASGTAGAARIAGGASDMTGTGNSMTGGRTNNGALGGNGSERFSTQNPVLFQGKSEFTQFIALGGAGQVEQPTGGRVFFRKKSAVAEPKESESGLRNVLHLNLDGETFVELYRDVEQAIVTDAYHHQKEMVFDRSEISLMQLCPGGVAETTVREVVNIPDMYDGVDRVAFLSGGLTKVASRVEGNKNVVEGLVAAKLVCLTDDENAVPFSIRREIPFRIAMDLPGGMEDAAADNETLLKELRFDRLNNRQIELNASVMVNSAVIGRKQCPLIRNVGFLESSGPEKETPGFVLYITRSGDTLWKIARRYRTTIDTVARINGIDQVSALKPGTKLLIVK